MPNKKTLNLLLEIYTEEIPAKMQNQAALDFRNLLHQRIEDLSTDIHSYITPNRIVLVVNSLPEVTPEVIEERRGPKVGAQDAAIQGFTRALGLHFSDLVMRKGYWFADIKISPKPVAQVLASILKEMILNFTWPKSMYWPQSNFNWVRPIRHILCLLDDEILDLGCSNFPCQNWTVGTRFVNDEKIFVKSFADYKEKLAPVVLSKLERESIIQQKLTEQNTTFDQNLVQEVAGIVEIPNLHITEFSSNFLNLPHEVLAEVLKVQQKCFPVYNESGDIRNKFIFASNHAKASQTMLHGFQKVVTARLKDAEFFYQQDMKNPLQKLLPKLQGITWHRDLGSIGCKVQRLKNLATTSAAQEALKDLAGGGDFAKLHFHGCQAIELCKVDLLTLMVKEFANLQGIMGGIYAKAQGIHEDIANAIYEHYSASPKTPLGMWLALLDRLDTLSSFFAINQLPSGSKDPFALRRAALSIIQIIRGKISSINPLLELLQEESAVITRVGEFLKERLKQQLLNEGKNHDAVNAVLSNMDYATIDKRLHALEEFLHTDKGLQLQNVAKRCYNIVKDQKTHPGIDSSIWVTKVSQVLLKPLPDEPYDCLVSLAEDVEPLEGLFANEMINHSDVQIRMHRLDILKRWLNRLEQVADFSKLDG